MASVADRRRQADKVKEKTLAKNPALAQLATATGRPIWTWGETLSLGGGTPVTRTAALCAYVAISEYARNLSTPSQVEMNFNPWAPLYKLIAPQYFAMPDMEYPPPTGMAQPPHALIQERAAQALKIPYGASIEDFWAWTPRDRILRLASSIRAQIGSDDKYWPAIDNLAKDIRERLRETERPASRAVAELYVALYREPELVGRPIKVPHKSLFESLAELFKNVGNLIAKIADAASDGSLTLDEGFAIFGAARSAVGKMSEKQKQTRKRLELCAKNSWFGPELSKWVQEDLELWELLRDLEV